MRLTDPAFILLGLLCIVVWLVGAPADRALKDAKSKLSAEDLELFRTQYRRKSRRATMPTRFLDVAAATDRAARIWVIAALAVVLSLVWIVAAGPGLGLFPNP